MRTAPSSLISSLIHARAFQSITGYRGSLNKLRDQPGQPWIVILNPEKRKVGGSTPPLTTTSDLRERGFSVHAPASLVGLGLSLGPQVQAEVANLAS